MQQMIDNVGESAKVPSPVQVSNPAQSMFAPDLTPQTRFHSFASGLSPSAAAAHIQALKGQTGTRYALGEPGTLQGIEL